MNFKDLPAPSEYSDWQSWAASLVSSLSALGEGNNNYPLFVYDDTKVRKGLPVAADGDMIRVLQGGEIKFKVWRDKTQGWEDIVKAEVTQADLQGLRSEINASLAKKANTDMNNLTHTGTTAVGNWAKATGREYISYTPPVASGTNIANLNITAPESGYLMVRGTVSNTDSYCTGRVDYNGGRVLMNNAAPYSTTGAIVPMAKGHVATIYCQANLSITSVRFYRNVGYYVA